MENTLAINPETISEIRKVCAENGLGLVTYLEAIKRGLNAKRTIYDSYGDELRTVDDVSQQLKSAMLGLELEGYIKAKSTIINTDVSTQVNIAVIHQEIQERIHCLTTRMN